MVRLSEIMEELEALAPSALKEPWDNVGLMVGDETQKIEKVYVCLDLTSENVTQAIYSGADLIVSHHPLIFNPLYSVTENDPIASMIRKVIKNDVSVFSMHTNFDKADGGMNDLLAHRLGLENVRKFTEDECVDASGNHFSPIGRVGMLEYPLTLEDFILRTKDVLGCSALKYSGDLSEPIQTVALCSGSGGKEGIYAAFHSGADVYVTADLSHEHARSAYEFGLNIVDAGHFETENIICNFLAEFFRHRFPDLEVITSDAKPFYSRI
ncbi:MAG: Nif3-like dinuclear metal center hexameric protein [Clostridia bacterium]|nr:Nif3-like dinuclear metal center hexameric protein [Clostridia bacterium]